MLSPTIALESVLSFLRTFYDSKPSKNPTPPGPILKRISKPVENTICVSKGGTKRLAAVTDSVWEWAAIAMHQCPIKPVANLGEGINQANPPDFLIEAHKSALETIECNQYAPTGGLPRLTNALSKWYSPLYGRTVDANSEISVHSGGTEAILSTLTAFVEPGDEVVVFEPAFDLYELHVRFLGGRIRAVQLHPPEHAATRVSMANEWTFDEKELERAMGPRTKVMVINTPHNPLGKIFTPEELTTIGTLCVKHGIIILSDEVYEHLYYTPNFPRIATLDPSFTRHTVTIGSFGKAFNATGWRVGYAIGDRDLIRHVKNAHIILSFTTAGPVQVAAAVGLEEAERNGFWESNREVMRGKIGSLCKTFEDLGLPYVKPMGAHYVLLNAGRVKIPDDYVFPEKLLSKTRDWRLSYLFLQEFGVATIPASASFGNANRVVADDYLRFVVNKPKSELDLARERLGGLRRFL